jgi:hypothetical protein
MIARPTAVYLIKNTWSVANYKVGITSNIPRRIAEIEDQYGVDAKLIYACWFPDKDSAKKAELFWHRHFADCLTDDHPGKEWFSLPPPAVKKFQIWSLASPSKQTILRKVYKMGLSMKALKRLSSQLVGLIPHHPSRASIDVWANPLYSFH